MSEKYLGENSTPLLINQIKENCTQKRSTLPIASIDELGNTYQYTGTTSGSLVHGYFYECVSDGQDPATYFWSQVNIQPTAETPTASGTTFDNTTSGLSATNVQDAIDEVDATVDGLSTDVDNIKDVVPSTATSSNKLVDHDSLGTAAFKDSTDRVSPNNTALVESQSVYSAINTALSSIYTPRGDITCAELTSDLLIEANVGNIYETSDSGTTTALFLQGAGHPIAVGSNVGIINAGQGRILFNLMANAFDLTDYQKKDLTQSVEGATTVEGALGALSTDKQAKTLTTSVESQTTVEGALGALSINKATQAEVNDVVNVLGAKNILPNNAVSQTITDVQLTVNNDGSVTATGTSSGAWNLRLAKFVLKKGTYILSGRGNANIFTQIVNNTESTNIASTENATEKQFTIDNDTEVIGRIFWHNGVTFDNVTMYPMLRLASDPDNTYAPYAMTNKQITDIVPSDASVSNKLVTNTNIIYRYDLTASANTLAAVKTALETFYTSSTATTRTPYCGYITASGAVWWYEFEKVDASYGYGELRYYDVDNTWYTFRVGTGVFEYQPVLNAELLSASNTFTPSSGYEILDWSVYQLGNHVWGTFILHKTSGDIPAGQTEVGNFSSTLRNAVNSVCFCSNNRYGGGAFYIGYLFVDQTGKMLMGNPSGTTTGINHAKISIDFCLA